MCGVSQNLQVSLLSRETSRFHSCPGLVLRLSSEFMNRGLLRHAVAEGKGGSPHDNTPMPGTHKTVERMAGPPGCLPVRTLREGQPSLTFAVASAQLTQIDYHEFGTEISVTEG